MSYRIKTIPHFDNEVKRIAKKHKGIKSDIEKLIENLEKNPAIGTELGKNIYKIRLAISGTNKGKSGGARVITCVVVVSEIVYLTEIYLKSERDTVDIAIVIQRLKDNGVI
jgi:mRNA-degrading endonuclease RelE of RelBE toxin-antitoxin system